ncbi:DUF6271 family protein [Streptomyces noursei]|uniref:DUF6271 family protein n=1 Tax=Streptomyces noursei TaxID=1971 RepID=UPI001963B768|nr:DUF6271 family protein [Streptomyces noursei]QRX95235.1 hypothetical protein JNO44_34470 [Streptomyces noursei]
MPTNRPFEAAFRSVAAEVAALPEEARHQVTLLVVDDCPPQVSRANRQVVEDTAAASGVRGHVLDAAGWERLAHDILVAAALPPAEHTLAERALCKPTGSYGAGPNKAALVAAYVGAHTLHRRDSDQITHVDPASGASPLRIEAELLDGGAAAGSKGAHCVGSSLTGRPTRDRRDLLHCSAEYVDRIDALSRLTPAETRVVRPAAPARPEQLTAHGGVTAHRDHTGTVEMGIAAVRRVHEWIPEMPAVGVLGSDYFQKGLLYQLELPVWHHDMTAEHHYEPWRAEQTSAEHLGWYARAELRYAVLRKHWNAFNEALMSQRDLLLPDGQHFDSRAYAEFLVDTLARGAERAAPIPPAFVALYREAAATASGDVRRRLDIRIAALEAEAGTTEQYVADAIGEFAALTRRWPALVAAAGRLGSDRDLGRYA